MSATSRRTRTMPAPLPPTALRGLLDATPAAVGCFDNALRAVYANTAFTMATGVQAGRVLEGDALTAAARAARRAGADAGLRHAVHARGRADRDGARRGRPRGARRARRRAVRAAPRRDAGGRRAGAGGGL